MDPANSIGYLVAALIVSMVIPAVNNLGSSWIKSNSEQKLKRIELYELRRLDRIEQYVREANRCIQSETVCDSFSEISAGIFLYIPRKMHDLVDGLNYSIQYGEFQEAASFLRRLCDALSSVDLLSASDPVKRKNRTRKKRQQD